MLVHNLRLYKFIGIARTVFASGRLLPGVITENSSN
jgi:hypothetical protein